MKKFLQNWLADLSRRIIAKHRPKIIGITGSVGKTSARDAIFAVLKEQYSVRKGEKNFNNELGLPFTVLGVNSPGRNILKWLWVFAKGYLILWFGYYPKVLLLEMGVDRPGDMDYLLSIARPDVAVVTSIGISHYEFFKSYQAVAEEKGKIVQALKEGGTAILNADSDLALEQASKTTAKVITYGVGGKCNVKMVIEQESFVPPGETTAIVKTSFNDFQVSYRAVGLPHAEAVAAAISVGLTLNVPVEKIQKGLLTYKPVPGRLNLIKGIRQITLLDDTYNASPDSTIEALRVLDRMPQNEKVAVLGDMLELGDLSESSHRQVGAEAAKLDLSMLITVGSLAKFIQEQALVDGLPQDKCFWFQTSGQAKDFLRKRLIPESAILIKGSQGARMEKISRELLAEPQSAEQLLPRQYGKWLKE